MKQPRPFFRRYTRSWYVQIGRKQINLGRDRKTAWEKYHQIMASRHDLTSATVTMAQFFEAYLDWVQKRKAPGTYVHVKHYLASFVSSVGTRLTLSRLRPTHLTKWIDRHENWSDTSRNDAISHVQRAFSWAVNQKYLERSPIEKVEDKPPRRRREVVYTSGQWAKIVSHVKDQCFLDLLTFMWETGCRPMEARRVESRHVDLKNQLVVFPPSEAKGGRERVIFLTDAATAVCERLCKTHLEGPILRNSRGRPWTKDSVACRFSRLKQKVRIRRLCAYGIRHTFATEGLKNGVDSLSLATIMGHADVSMLARTYQHLAENTEYLREQAKKARGRGA